MTDAPSGNTNYAGNSQKDKQPETTAEPRATKVISGEAVERKPSLGKRIASNFTGSDAKSVGEYILLDVVLPRIKDLIFDVGESALRRALFGDKAGTYGGRSAGKAGWTPYGSYAAQGATSKAAATPAPEERSDEFTDILLQTRPEAEMVMEKMDNLVDSFNAASVADLKTLVGKTANITDEAWGWTHLGGANIRRVGGSQPGYVISFPNPTRLP